MSSLLTEVDRYKIQLEKCEQEIETLRRAREPTPTTCNQCSEKDATIDGLCRQLEEKRRLLSGAQNKLKAINSGMVAELTKQLEGKIKEVEMLKEMLRSSKIELTGREKEIKRLRAKILAAAPKPKKQSLPTRAPESKAEEESRNAVRSSRIVSSGNSSTIMLEANLVA